MSAPPRAAEILERLIAFPTVAGTPNVELVAWVADLLDGAGAEVAVLPGTRPDARNLHAVLGPADVPGVVLSAHSDVVDPAGQAWSGDPFVLRRADGRLYGRGTADMKGFLAAALAAACAARGRRLRRPLHVALSSDEELGCRGVGPLLDALAALEVRPRYAIVGEPTELRVVVAHKGKAAWRVRVRGRACHSALAPQGVNAVAYAARLVVALDELGRELARGPLDAAFSVPHATLSAGPIAGGVAVNLVPDACRVDFELRTLPGQAAEEVLARVAKVAAALEAEMHAVDPETGIELEPLAAYPGLAAEPDGAAAREVARLAGTEAGGAVDFGTEAGLYQQRLGIPVVVCGPGSMAQGHRPDEFVAVAQLEAAEAMLHRLVDELAAPA